jgi:hypothetical protein
MSPEQILGDKLDFRSDVFSLGIVLYQMATGRKPFIEDDARTVMQKIRLDRYTSPRKLNAEVPRALERIMARCMEKMPANRYPTTQGLIDDLMDFLSSRVPINHNARVVMYLRELNVVTDDEAEEILAASTPNRTRRTGGDRSVVRGVWIVNAILAMAIVGSGGAIQAASGRLSGDGDRFTAEAGAPVVPQRAGHLRFVVEPWAEVHIDGQHVLTTPSARRVALPAGRHWLKFRSQAYPEVNQEVWVREGETQLIEIDLDGADAPPLPPAPAAEPPAEEEEE